MFNYQHYVGLPCTDDCNPPSSFNCWELVKYVRQTEFGLETPFLATNVCGVDPQGVIANILGSSYVDAWQEIKGKFVGGDLVLIATQNRNSFDHVGVFVEPSVILHTAQTSVMSMKYRIMQRAFKNSRVYRCLADRF